MTCVFATLIVYQFFFVTALCLFFVFHIIILLMILGNQWIFWGIYFNDDSSFGGLEIENIPRRYLVPFNPFEDLSNRKFIEIYRLQKERVANIINIVRQHQPILRRRSALDVPQQVSNVISLRNNNELCFMLTIDQL